MKKLTGILIAAALILAPMSVSALEMMTDSNMKDVTGQAGVSIIVDDIVLEQWVGSTTYTDNDGTDGTAGSISLNDQHTVQNFQAITESTDPGTFSTLASPGQALTQSSLDPTALSVLGGSFQAHALTIDVGTCPVYSAGATYNSSLAGGGALTMTGVVIGLPTLEINTSASTTIVTAGQAGAANDGAEFIQIDEGASTLHVLGGTVEIAPH